MNIFHTLTRADKMVNKIGGKKHKRAKGDAAESVRELQFKEEGEEYGLVMKMLGGGNAQVKFPDGTSKIAHIRGAFRKRVWINNGDLVLVGIRSFQDGKVDIINKYTPDEHRMLKSYKEVSFDEKMDADVGNQSETVDVTFGLDIDSI
jgi:translation initiation factor 1A